MLDTLLVLVKLAYMIIFEPPLACFSKIFFRKTRPDFSNDIVLVTGGAQGIGKEIAILVSLG